eukprot:15230732-Alexandrium_andersonii.AAC.1
MATTVQMSPDHVSMGKLTPTTAPAPVGRTRSSTSAGHASTSNMERACNAVHASSAAARP